MTATQVFLLFLKKNCILQEYLFFRNIIMNDNGNRFFRKRRLYKNTFVEDYLSRNNRTLSNFMTRMFILAPNLKNQKWKNPRYYIIRNGWKIEHEGKEYKKEFKNFLEFGDDIKKENINVDIVERIIQNYDVKKSKDEIIDMINRNKHNSITTTYFLMLRKFGFSGFGHEIILSFAKKKFLCQTKNQPPYELQAGLFPKPP